MVSSGFQPLLQYPALLNHPDTKTLHLGSRQLRLTQSRRSGTQHVGSAVDDGGHARYKAATALSAISSHPSVLHSTSAICIFYLVYTRDCLSPVHQEWEPVSEYSRLWVQSSALQNRHPVFLFPYNIPSSQTCSLSCEDWILILSAESP